MTPETIRFVSQLRENFYSLLATGMAMPVNLINVRPRSDEDEVARRQRDVAQDHVVGQSDAVAVPVDGVLVAAKRNNIDDEAVPS